MNFLETEISSELTKGAKEKTFDLLKECDSILQELINIHSLFEEDEEDVCEEDKIDMKMERLDFISAFVESLDTTTIDFFIDSSASKDESTKVRLSTFKESIDSFCDFTKSGVDEYEIFTDKDELYIKEILAKAIEDLVWYIAVQFNFSLTISSGGESVVDITLYKMFGKDYMDYINSNSRYRKRFTVLPNLISKHVELLDFYSTRVIPLIQDSEKMNKNLKIEDIREMMGKDDLEIFALVDEVENRKI